jgi:hypothetical protein
MGHRMALRRTAAVVVAVLLVVGAFVVRSLTDHGGDDGTGPRPGTDGGRVTCVADLADACRAVARELGVDVTVERWLDTAARLDAGEAVGTWVTLAPLDALVETGDRSLVASSQLGLLGRADRMAALADGCAGTAIWRCVGDQAGRPWSELGGEARWGSLLPGLADPTASAVGALVLAHANTAFFGGPAFNNVVMDASDEHASWFAGLVAAVPDQVLDHPVAVFVGRPSVAGVVGSTSADFESTGGGRLAEFTATYPEPMGRADVVVAGEAPDGFVEAIAAQLLAASWQAPASGPNGMPSAATMRALAQRWEEDR